MPTVEERVDTLETVLKQFIIHTNSALGQLEREMREFKDEMKVFKDEMKEFQKESEKDRREMNKKWGEIANKMGTLVEDIVVPNIEGIAQRYFDCQMKDDTTDLLNFDLLSDHV